MEVLYLVPRQNFSEVENELLKDDVTSRQSLTFRSAANYGIKDDAIVVRISGSEEGVDQAKDIIKDRGKIVEGSQKEKILKMLKDEEDSVAQGFGSIFE